MKLSYASLIVVGIAENGLISCVLNRTRDLFKICSFPSPCKSSFVISEPLCFSLIKVKFATSNRLLQLHNNVIIKKCTFYLLLFWIV